MTDNITLPRSVVEQALWTLEDVFGKHKVDVGAINALRAALEHPQVAQEPEHITDGRPCWCEPELDYKDPETGAEVWVHRRAQ